MRKPLQSSLFLRLIVSLTLAATIVFSIRIVVRIYWEIPKYLAIEKEADLRVVNRVNNVLQQRTSQLTEAYISLQAWDELYEFIESPNQAFIDEQMASTEWENSITSAVFIINNQGDVVWNFLSNELQDFASDTHLSLDDLRRSAWGHAQLISSNPISGIASGISSELLAPVIFLTFPVYPTNYARQPNGYIVVWELLAGETLEKMKTTLQTDFAFQRVNPATPTKRFAPENLRRDNHNMISWTLNDHAGNPSYNIHLFLDKRNFDARVLDPVTLIELLSALVIFLLLAWNISLRIIKPINALRKSMINIRDTRDYGSRVKVKTTGELGSLSQEYNSLLEHIQKQEEALKASNNELLQLSNMDPLTGIANRRAFDNFINEPNLALPVSLLMIDIDHFKKYNDHYGHPKGDSALKKVAKTLQGNIHIATDLASRYGGEEFAIVLTNTSSSQAQLVAQRMIDAVKLLQIPHEKSEYQQISISIGLCTSEAAFTPKSLIQCADKALYSAKANGRNRFEHGVS